MHSSHPIAKSFIKELEEKAELLELEKIKEIKGQGIQANGKEIFTNLDQLSLSIMRQTHQIYLIKTIVFLLQ